MSEIMRKLEIIASQHKPNLPGFTGRAALCGEYRGVRWIATEDFDGQIEISVSRADGRRATRQQTRALFSFCGRSPVEGPIHMPVATHFVLVAGRQQ